MRRVVGAALLVLALAAPAGARSARELPYGYDQVWPALVRFLRVDEKLKISEKDDAAGYVLFEVTDGKRSFTGSAELAKIGRVSRLQIRIQDRPSYMEQALLDRFASKLKDELGDPPPAPPPPAEPQPDAPPANEGLR